MIYETDKEPKEGCLTAIILLIICIVFGLLVGCEKSALSPIKIDEKKIRKCLDCKIKSIPALDTVLIKQN